MALVKLGTTIELAQGVLAVVQTIPHIRQDSKISGLQAALTVSTSARDAVTTADQLSAALRNAEQYKGTERYGVLAPMAMQTIRDLRESRRFSEQNMQIVLVHDITRPDIPKPRELNMEGANPGTIPPAYYAGVFPHAEAGGNTEVSSALFVASMTVFDMAMFQQFVDARTAHAEVGVVADEVFARFTTSRDNHPMPKVASGGSKEEKLKKIALGIAKRKLSDVVNMLEAADKNPETMTAKHKTTLRNLYNDVRKLLMLHFKLPPEDAEKGADIPTVPGTTMAAHGESVVAWYNKHAGILQRYIDNLAPSDVHPVAVPEEGTRHGSFFMSEDGRLLLSGLIVASIREQASYRLYTRDRTAYRNAWLHAANNTILWASVARQSMAYAISAVGDNNPVLIKEYTDMARIVLEACRSLQSVIIDAELLSGKEAVPAVSGAVEKALGQIGPSAVAVEWIEWALNAWGRTANPRYAQLNIIATRKTPTPAMIMAMGMRVVYAIYKGEDQGVGYFASRFAHIWPDTMSDKQREMFK